MEQTFKLSGYNLQAIYVYGTEEQAREYLSTVINAGRDINHYYIDSIVNHNDEAINLDDALSVEGLKISFN